MNLVRLLILQFLLNVYNVPVVANTSQYTNAISVTHTSLLLKSAKLMAPTMESIMWKFTTFLKYWYIDSPSGVSGNTVTDVLGFNPCPHL